MADDKLIMAPLAAEAYYRITDVSYRYLDSRETTFMNLGHWSKALNPQQIREAQTALVTSLAEYLQAFLAETPHSLVELGPGWGGSRKVLFDAWPSAHYLGVNSSERQIKFAELLNSHLPNTRYLNEHFENFSYSPAGEFAVFAVESILHVEEKEQVFRRLISMGAQAFALAEIVVEERCEIDSNPLFNPSLRYTWPIDQYRVAFERLNFKFESIDITPVVFQPWSQALSRIEPSEFRGHCRVLRQFQQSYARLAELASAGAVSYHLMRASRGLM